MPLNQINGILDIISEEALARQKGISDGADERFKQAMKNAEDRVNAEIEEIIKVKSAEINSEAGMKISSSESEFRAKLFKRREEIRNSVFADATAEIKKFTQTDDYKNLLISSAKRIQKEMNGKCAVLYIREEDRPLASEICGYLGNSITVHISREIKLGGIIVSSANGSMMVDDSLDNRLNEMQNWFTENSGLVIE